MLLHLIGNNIRFVDDRTALCGALEQGAQTHAIDTARNAHGTLVDFGFGVVGEYRCWATCALQGVVDVLARILEGQS